MRGKRSASLIRKKYKVKDIAFGALNEQFIREYQSYIEVKCGYSNQTSRHHLALLKRICRIAYKEGFSERYHFLHFKIPKQKETTPKALSREDFEKLRDLETRKSAAPSSLRGTCSCLPVMPEPPMRTPYPLPARTSSPTMKAACG